MQLSDMVSRIDPRLSASTRHDPYWEHMWPSSSGGLGTSWWSRQSVEHAQSTDVTAKFDIQRSIEDAQALVLSEHRRLNLNILAAIVQWRTVTAEQLSTITGRRGLKDRYSEPLNLLWEAGLIQKGQLIGGYKMPSLWRPNFRAQLKRWFRQLDYNEWVGLSTGDRLAFGSQFDRHNILSTEIGLRIGEYHDNIVAVFGEGECLLSKIFGKDPKTVSSTKTADVVAVRSDGLRIVIEVTASLSPHFADKVDSWAQLLADDVTESTVVLFVDVAQPGDTKVPKNLRKGVAASARGSMGAQLSKVYQRMFIASWNSWFPGPNEVDESFVGLMAEYPSSGVGDKTSWESLSLVSPFDVPGLSTQDGEQIAKNASHIWGTPFWLRNRPDPPFGSDLLAPRLRQIKH